MPEPTGYMVVIAGPDSWIVPAQVLERDHGNAAAARERGNQRAALSGREPAYRVAEVAVEGCDE